MRLRLPISLFLLSSAAMAQQITLRGKVEDAAGGNQFVVDCSSTRLTSATFDLNTFVGQQVLITGTQVGTPQAPLVEVATIAVIPEIFEIPGNPEVGNELRFGATHTPGARVSFFVALGPGFRRVGRAGTFMLDLSTTVFATAGTIPAPGNLELVIPLPNDPALIGRDVHAQALLFSGGALVISNPDCKTIR